MPRSSEAISPPENSEQSVPEPTEQPYDLEILTPITRPIIELWGRTTTSRIAELRMNGANEWARFLTDIFETVGSFVEGSE